MRVGRRRWYAHQDSDHRDRNFTEAKLKRDLQCIDDRLDYYLDQMNESDTGNADSWAHAVADLKAKLASILERNVILAGNQQRLVESGEAQLSLMEPDPGRSIPGQRSALATTS